ncbi:MAG: hypothetical protein ABIJ82_00545 [Patescibacteria group bacterium]|nr:hypothetical protein [Patescibacteria group bacterium]MBU1952777.1 hypothetical protein [Patescibacteria group bacterium]
MSTKFGPDDENENEDVDSTFTPRDTRGWDEEDTHDYDKWEKDNEGNDDQQSEREVKETWHSARDDYQDSGSPFGELPGRDRG